MSDTEVHAQTSGMSRKRKRLIIVGAALLVLVGAGVALAAYLSSGVGAGQANASEAVNSTITPGANGTALYPGATGTFTVTINNPNAYPVTVTSISAGSSQATGADNACAAGTVTSSALTNPPNTVIPPGGSGTYTLTSTMIADPDNSCQGASFTLPLTAQLTSAA